jgi:hypothetical protein
MDAAATSPTHAVAERDDQRGVAPFAANSGRGVAAGEGTTGLLLLRFAAPESGFSIGTGVWDFTRQEAWYPMGGGDVDPGGTREKAQEEVFRKVDVVHEEEHEDDAGHMDRVPPPDPSGPQRTRTDTFPAGMVTFTHRPLSRRTGGGGGTVDALQDGSGKTLSSASRTTSMGVGTSAETETERERTRRGRRGSMAERGGREVARREKKYRFTFFPPCSPVLPPFSICPPVLARF